MFKNNWQNQFAEILENLKNNKYLKNFNFLKKFAEI